MKKLFNLFLIFVLLISGCASKKTVAPVESETPPTSLNEAVATENEFVKSYRTSQHRPIAIMVDNDNKDAWPHAGLQDAYLIYEVPVEGGATRLMAVFNEKNTDKIGPIRSSRHYFLDYMLEHDAIYTHFGYSPKAMHDIPALGVNNINGVIGSDSGAFWRENKYIGDYHSAYTSMEKINNMIRTKGYRTDRQSAPLQYNDEDIALNGSAATDITIPYSGFYRSGFCYNEETSAYEKYMNGSTHALQGDASLSVKNIIIMTVKCYSLGDGSARLNIDTVGNGKGFYITMGQAVPITWEKSSRTAKTIWKDAAGKEITLNPGQTWVMITPSTVNTSIQ
ncbi:MAG: DUF3048 domain-containing protein [Clostridia bacterium]|nr:DUF3048 domain-containing protein [Clostridia bacterium]